MLIQYARNEKNEPVGAVVALDRNRIGWSLCHRKDHWDRKKALMIAENRAENGYHTKVPHILRPVMAKMEKRAKAYFK